MQGLPTSTSSSSSSSSSSSNMSPYTGDDCQLPGAFGPNNRGCGPHGQCFDPIPMNMAYQCTCRDGWTGANCDIAPPNPQASGRATTLALGVGLGVGLTSVLAGIVILILYMKYRKRSIKIRHGSLLLPNYVPPAADEWEFDRSKLHIISKLGEGMEWAGKTKISGVRLG